METSVNFVHQSTRAGVSRHYFRSPLWRRAVWLRETASSRRGREIITRSIPDFCLLVIACNADGSPCIVRVVQLSRQTRYSLVLDWCCSCVKRPTDLYQKADWIVSGPWCSLCVMATVSFVRLGRVLCTLALPPMHFRLTLTASVRGSESSIALESSSSKPVDLAI